MLKRHLFLLALAVSVSIESGVQAQEPLRWTVAFFDNVFLAGTAVMTRTDTAPSLAYHWGYGAPGSGVRADNFSARWGADAPFEAGTYRFTAQADDALRVTVDFQPVIDTLETPRAGQVVQADVVLTAGTHHLQVDYLDYGGDAYLYLDWALAPANGPQPFDATWTAQYFDNPRLRGAPALTRREAGPAHFWGADSPAPGLPADDFSARWTGLHVLAAGSYQIAVRADDGVRVYVDDHSVVNEFHAANGQTYTASFPLAAGLHSIVVEYYDGGETAFLEYALTPLILSAEVPPVMGSVAAPRADVYSAPDRARGAVLGQVNGGESYPVIGQKPEGDWRQIDFQGAGVWVEAGSLNVASPNDIPLVASASGTLPVQPASSCPGIAASRLAAGGHGQVVPGAAGSLAAIPSATGSPLGSIPPGAVLDALAGPLCLSNMAWWYVNYDRLSGWAAEGVGDDYWIEPAQLR